jgi:(S)-ureidoglycine aminohydrolase
MKILLLTTVLLSASSLLAQSDSLLSHVYNWSSLVVKNDSSRDRRQVLEGKTHSLAYLEVHASTLEAGKAPHPPHTHADMEELIIVKEGKLKVMINGVTTILDAGGVALALPGEEHGFENGGSTPATYYVLKFKARAPMNTDRGKQAGGSLVIDWNKVVAQPTDKGMRRNLFERPTALFAKFEMHVTTLNEGQISHPPHTHPQEEIVLLRKGDVQMQIGDEFFKAGPGDVIFLSSNKPHALKNTGSDQCEYYAFQWN